jgi:hypothetical protein
MQNEAFNQAMQDLESNPGFSRGIVRRLDLGFQRFTVVPGLRFNDAYPTSGPGDMPGQSGPSPLIEGPGGSGAFTGDFSPTIFNLIGSLGTPTAPTAHPDSVPPIGPEERIRYSCLSGKCIQDPNGIYLGIDECLADGCGSPTSGGGGGGGGSKGCDCGCGPSQTVLKAQITGASGPFTVSGKTYWTYSWGELAGSGRSSSAYGDAANEYETSMPNDGGNVVPVGTILSRLRIPNGAVVDLVLDENCVPWFETPNPLEVTCE